MQAQELPAEVAPATTEADATEAGTIEATVTEPDAVEAELSGPAISEPAPPEQIPPEQEVEQKFDSQAVSPLYKQTAGKIETVGPDTFILLDAEGNPQPVLGMSYEEFIAAWKNQQALRNAGDSTKRSYTLDEFSGIGSIEPNYVGLTANFRITLHTDKVVEVPLRFGKAILQHLPQPAIQNTPSHPNKGRYLDYSVERGGYFVTLQGKPGEIVRMQIDLIVPVHRDGDRVRLRMLVPRATKNSLTLISKDPIEKVVASEGVMLATRSLAVGVMRVEATGIGGELALSWAERQPHTNQLATVLVASGKIYCDIDGRSMHTQAELTVQSFGGPFREFSVRLPPGARRLLRELPPSVESISQDPVGAERLGGEGEGKVLIVRLTEDTQGPVVLKLETQQPIGVSKKSTPVELAGFEVLGAVRHYGEVALHVDDQWQLRQTLSDSVDEVSASDLDLTWQQPSLEVDDITTALRYFRQPWSLKVSLSKRQQRVVATPTYVLSISPNEATLQMKVAYHISGVRTFPVRLPLTFALEGWEIEETTPHGFDNIEETFRQDFDSSSGANYSEFRSASATTSQPDMVLKLKRLLPAGEQVFELPLPYPDQDRLSFRPSDLLVKVDSNLLVKPSIEKTGGLSPQPVNELTSVGEGQLQGQRFRYRGFKPRIVFAASRKNRPQRILVQVKTEVKLLQNRVEVQQDFTYDVRHQMLDSLLLQTPSGLLHKKNLRIELLPLASELNDQPELSTPLDYPTETPTETAEGSQQVELRIALPHPRIGRFRVRAHYSLPANQSPLEGNGGRVLPLLSSLEGDFGKQVLTVQSTSGLLLAPVAGSPWKIESYHPEERIHTFVSTEPTYLLNLVSTPPQRSEADLSLEKIWVQTWLTPALVQERTVFQFLGGGDSLVVELPVGNLSGDEVEIMLDGEEASNNSTSIGRLEIKVPKNTPSTRHTLELRYRFSRRLRWIESLRIERPRLAGNEDFPVIDWQIITPVEFSLVRTDSRLIKAFRSQWSSGNWRAMPDYDTTELEQQLGAVSRMTPTLGEQTYLFRTLDSTVPLRVTLARRELLVLGASALVLAACMGLWYVPGLRRAPVVLSGLVLLSAVGVAYPDAALFFVQASLLGSLCGLVGWLLVLLFKRSQSHRVVIATGSSSTLSTGTRESTILRSASNSASNSAASNVPTVSVEVIDPDS